MFRCFPAGMKDGAKQRMVIGNGPISFTVKHVGHFFEWTIPTDFFFFFIGVKQVFFAHKNGKGEDQMISFNLLGSARSDDHVQQIIHQAQDAFQECQQ